MSSTLNEKPTDRMLGDTTSIAVWEEKAKLWKHRLVLIAMPCLLESLMEFLQQFFNNQPSPKLAVFYLVAKTHKQVLASLRVVNSRLARWWVHTARRQPHALFSLPHVEPHYSKRIEHYTR